MGGVILEKIGDRIRRSQGVSRSVIKRTSDQDMSDSEVSATEGAFRPRGIAKDVRVSEVSVAQAQPGDHHIFSWQRAVDGDSETDLVIGRV